MRGPKKIHMAPYLGTLFGRIFFLDRLNIRNILVIATALSLPHFFEYKTNRLEHGNIVFEEDGLNKDFYYKLIFYSIIDPSIR